MGFVSVEQAIDDIKNGKMIVMVDDEDRENEGDIVFAADFSDTQKVNFTITHAKGVLCTPITRDLARKLDLNLMVDNNTSSHETAFTITIDAKSVKTGVSAYERDLTIKTLVNPCVSSGDFVRPGHINPLIAKDGGVLVRTGHTEGSVDLCRLAGLNPVAVICEIVNEDGTMARRDDLIKFCSKFGLNMISIADLVKYRLQHESLIKVGDGESIQILGKNSTKYEIVDHEGNVNYAFTFGDFSTKTNVRFHKISSDIELFMSDKFKEFTQSIEILDKNGGILVCLSKQDSQDGEIKNFGIGAQILKHFGIQKIDLLTNRNNKEFVAISGFGLDISSYKSLKS